MYLRHGIATHAPASPVSKGSCFQLDDSRTSGADCRPEQSGVQYYGCGIPSPATLPGAQPHLFSACLLALHRGAGGLRDDASLKSALSRPQHYLAYAESRDVIDM